MPYSYTQTEGRDARQAAPDEMQLQLETGLSPSSIPLWSYASGDIPQPKRLIDGFPALVVLSEEASCRQPLRVDRGRIQRAPVDGKDQVALYSRMHD